MLKRLVLAQRLSSAFRRDEYFRCYFAKGAIGYFARFLFFIDEVGFRYATGFVIQEGRAIALIGMPPNCYVRRTDLCVWTRFVIYLQGEPYRTRWNEIWLTSRDPASEGHVVYLSAIACPRAMRRKGNGSRLLERVKALAAERKLSVMCEVSTQQMSEWYSKRGFGIVGYSTLPCGTTVTSLIFPPQRGRDDSLSR